MRRLARPLLVAIWRVSLRVLIRAPQGSLCRRLALAVYAWAGDRLYPDPATRRPR